MATATLTLLADLRRASNAVKCTRDWQEQLWAHWPEESQWPGSLDIYEAAAFRRIHPDTIRRACTSDRKGKARLAHQRLGAAYRIRKADLARLGAVEEKERSMTTTKRVPLMEARKRPISAGSCFRFINVGELILPGDDYYNMLGQWVPTTLRRVVCSAANKNLYRRRVIE